MQSLYLFVKQGAYTPFWSNRITFSFHFSDTPSSAEISNTSWKCATCHQSWKKWVSSSNLYSLHSSGTSEWIAKLILMGYEMHGNNGPVYLALEKQMCATIFLTVPPLYNQMVILWNCLYNSDISLDVAINLFILSPFQIHSHTIKEIFIATHL